MLRNIFYVTVLIYSFLWIGCHYLSRKEPPVDKGKLLARVGSKQLFLEEVKSFFTERMSEEDSVALLESIVTKWVKETLLLERARMNLMEESEEFERLIDEYRKSLLIHAYESKLVDQYMDTVVSDEEIYRYFKENQKEFVLKENIVKAFFLKFHHSTPKIEEFAKKLNSPREQDQEFVMKYIYQHASQSHVDTSVWILLNDMRQLLGTIAVDEEILFQRNKTLMLHDSANVYFIKIFDFKVKDNLPPVEFVRDEIKTIILMKRRMSLLQELKRELYMEAVKNKQVEIYLE